MQTEKSNDVMNPLTMLWMNQNMGLRCSHEGLERSAQRLLRSVTGVEHLSPRVAEGRLKNRREATKSTKRDEEILSQNLSMYTDAARQICRIQIGVNWDTGTKDLSWCSLNA